MQRSVTVQNYVRAFQRVAPGSVAVFKSKDVLDVGEVVVIGDPETLVFDHRNQQFYPAKWPEDEDFGFYLSSEELDRASVGGKLAK